MAEDAGVVNFYSVSDEFGAFSNFAGFPIVLDGEYWGDGSDGSGKNMLGRVLMQVRDTLRVAPSA
jgi:predicted NAD-dependent protein-ADP-ribosyltransferase YbiA (DUF1768 family)